MCIFKENRLIKNTPSDSAETPENTPIAVENAPEKISDNYFEQVNTEFQKEVLKGNIGPEAIEEIKNRNEATFMEKVVDAIKNPGEAYKWLKTAVITSLAGSWLGDIFGVSDALKKAKEKVMEVVKNPMNILIGVLGGFAGFKALKGIAGLLKAPGSGSIGIIKKTFSGLRMATGVGLRLAALGTMGYAAIKLYEYFTENEEEASGMPQDKESQKTWWKEKIEKSGLKDELKEEEIVPLMALVMGEEKAEEMFKDLMEVDEKRVETEESKEKSQKEKELENEYGELIPLSEYIKEKTNGVYTLIENKTKDLINEIKRNESLLATAAFLTLGIKDSFELLAKTGITAGKLTMEGISTLIKLAYATGNHPIISILATLGILKTLEISEETKVPKDDKQFRRYISDICKEKYDGTVEAVKKAREKTGEFLEKNDLKFINEKEIEETIVYTEDKTEKTAIAVKKLVEDFYGSLALSIEKAVEYIALSDQEIFVKRHIEVIKDVLTRIDDFKRNENKEDDPDIQNLIEEFDKIINQIRNGKTDEIDLNNLEIKIESAGFKMFEQDGYICIELIDDDGISEGVLRFMVDPDIKDPDERKRLNKYLVPNNENGMEYATKAFWEKTRNMVEELREALKKGKLYLLMEGGLTILEGATERYIVGPASFFQKTAEIITDEIGLTDNNDCSLSQLWISYGDSIAPILVFTLAKTSLQGILFSKSVRKGFGKTKLGRIGNRVLIHSLAFPIHSTVDILNAGRQIAWPIIKGNPREAWNNIKMSDLSTNAKLAINGIMEKRYGLIPGHKSEEKNYLRKKRQVLIQAKKLLHEYQFQFLPHNKNATIENYNRMIEDFKEGSPDANELENLKIKESDRRGKSRNEMIQLMKEKMATVDIQLEENKRKLQMSKSDLKTAKETDQLIKAKEKSEELKTENNPIKKQKLQKEIEQHLDNAGERGKSIQSQNLRDNPDKMIQALDTEINKTHAYAVVSDYELNTKFHGFEKLNEKEKMKKLHEMDSDFISKVDEFRSKEESLLKRLSTRKKSRIKPEELRKLHSEYKAEIKKIIELRISSTEEFARQHPDTDFQKHGLHLDEGILDELGIDKTKIPSERIKKDALKVAIKNNHIEISPKLRMLKQYGKQALVVGVMLGLSMLVGYMGASSSNGDTDLSEELKKEKDDEEKKDTDKKVEELSNEELIAEAEIINQALDEKSTDYYSYLTTIGNPNGLSELLEEGLKEEDVSDVKDLEKLSFHKTVSYVNSFIPIHEKNSADIMRLLVAKSDVINEIFKRSPKLQKEGKSIGGDFLKLKWDKEKEMVYLQYAQEEELIDYSYMMIDQCFSWGMGWEIGGNFVPFVGSIRDLYRGWRNMERGNTYQAFKDYAWGGGGLILDVLSLGSSSIAKGGIKMVVRNAAKAEKIMSSLQVAKAGEKGMKALHTINMGADASELGYGFGAGINKEMDRYFEGIDPDTFKGRYEAKSWEEADDIPFSKPGVVRMAKEKVSNSSLEEMSIDIDQRFESIVDNFYWKNAEWEVVDINTIKVIRNTSDNEVLITRNSNGKWNLNGTLEAVGGYDTVEQAFVMANLSNDTMEWLENDKINVPVYGDISIEGANDTPFYISIGGDIEFDQNYSPVAINYFEEDSKWLETYKRSFEIPKDWIVNLLNRTYKKYLQKHSIT